MRTPAPPVRAWLPWVAVLLIGGCAREPVLDLAPTKVPPEKTLVTVNGEPLSLEEFDNEFLLMQIHYSAVTESEMRAIKRRLFEQVINRRLLVQQARRDSIGLTQPEADETLKDALKDAPEAFWALLKAKGIRQDSWKRKMLQERLARKVVEIEVDSKVRVTPKEVEDYYWAHLPNYWLPEAVHARHLIVQRKADLQKVLSSLSGGGDFAKVASIFSVGPERSKGGDWGSLETDRLSPAYVKVLRALKPGEISKPLKDDFGYHLFQLLEWRPRRMQSFPQVRDRIQDDLLREERDHRFDQWMSELKKRSSIKVNQDMALVIGVALED